MLRRCRHAAGAAGHLHSQRAPCEIRVPNVADSGPHGRGLPNFGVPDLLAAAVHVQLASRARVAVREQMYKFDNS